MYIRELGIRCPVTLSPFQSTDDAIDLMWQHDTRYLLVVDRQGLVGLVTDADLLESVGMLMRAERVAIGRGVSHESLIVADVMDSRCPCLTPRDPVSQAAQVLVREQRPALPIVDEDQLLGVIADEDLLQLFAGSCWLLGDQPHREPVIRFATRTVRTVGPGESLASACARLSGGRIRHLLVVEDSQLIGMLSDWEIRLAIGENTGGQWMKRAVREYMTAPVQALRPQDTLVCAAEVTRLEKVAAVPITTREGELLGIITVGDLLAALAWPAPVPA